MSARIVVYKFTGLTPLLQNNPACMTENEGGAGPKTGNKLKTYDDATEAAKRVYENADGHYYHPSVAVRASLLAIAPNRKIGKMAAKTLIAGGVFAVEDEMVILDAKLKPAKKWEIHKCRAVVGTSGIPRCRPMWWPWYMLVPIEIDNDFIPSDDQLTPLLNVAGKICGWGDHRPDTTKQKSGTGKYGRFTAEVYEAAKASKKRGKAA